MFPRHDAIAPAVWQEVQARLDMIRRDENVRVLMVVESGSRAWGFPSPDSDYDIRFVYVRPRDAYLALRPVRDVIEQPIVDEIDLNGWDIRKAIGLMLKSNAVASEWIESPIRYDRDAPVIAKLAALADAIFDPRSLGPHYASLGQAAAERWLDGDGAAPVKRYFYALRPALAIRHLRMHPDRRPPMNLQSLVAATALPAPIEAAIVSLIEAKARTNERQCRARPRTRRDDPRRVRPRRGPAAEGRRPAGCRAAG
jgi:predicted nucleotidyltransferase